MHFKSGGKAPSGLLLRYIFLVMKLIAFVLTIVTLHMCTPALSQRVSIAGKNLSLEQVFMEIRKQTGIEFVYESALLKAAHRVTLNVQQMPVEKVLAICLQGQGLGFNVRSNTIIIFKPVDDNPAEAPEDRVVYITGQVVDAPGQPVEMASVVLMRTNAGTQTDRTGAFMLKVKNLLPNDSLIISFVGLKTSVVDLHGKPDAGQITLQASDNALDEAMVIAYGTTSERFRTGDITTVKAVEIERAPALNAVEALSGRVPGLYIRQTGTAPSSVYNIQLRGYNIIPQDLTINPRDGVQILTRPLFVLDGLPLLPEVIDVFGANTGVDAITRLTGAGGGQDPLYWLNALDIESMSVLKDAEATALYGSRATNGVIMITTKKGKPGKTSVNITFNTGVNVLARKLKLLNTQQYLAVRHEAWANTMRAGLPVYAPTGTVSYTPNADNSYDLLKWDTTRYTDWQQVLLGSAPNYNAQLELSGGETVTYRLSAGYNSVKAPYPTVPGKKPFKEERGTFALKVASHSGNNRFKLVTAANGSVSASFQPAENPEPYIFLIPNAPAMLDEAGNINNADWQTSGPSTSLVTVNPLQVMTSTYHSNRFYMQVSTSLSYELFRSLVLTANAGYTRYDGRQLLRRPATSIDPASPLFLHTSFFGNSLGTAVALEPNLRYEVRLQRHHLIVQAGGSYQSDKQEGYTITASGYASEQLMDNLAGATSYSTNANYVQRRAVSVWGRVTYRYAGKYLADLSARRDGSSTFGPGNRYGNFGSAGLGWIFTEESWCRNIPLITFGKLRGSYGVTGNQNLRPYAYYSTYRPGGIYNGEPAFNLNRAANPTLGWVQAHSTDVGMDLYFLADQRLRLTVQWYQKITGDQLITDTISSVTGAGTYLHNLPVKVSNRGWEAMIDYRSPVRHSRISWDIHFNIAANKNKLLAYPDLEHNNTLRDYYEIGQPLYRQRLFPSKLDKTLGVYTFSAPVTVYTAVDDNPAFTGGMQAGLSWKGFSLAVACTFAKQKGFNNVQGSGPPGFLGGAPVTNQPLSVVQARHWQSPADSTLGGAFYVVPVTSQNLDIYWSDASYFGVKNASLNYQLPESYLRKVFINNLNFYIRAENLLFIPLSGYQGMNPEQPSLIYKQLPLRLTVVAGFTINL